MVLEVTDRLVWKQTATSQKAAVQKVLKGPLWLNGPLEEKGGEKKSPTQGEGEDPEVSEVGEE